MSITKHEGRRGVRYEVRYRGADGKERSKRFRARRPPRTTNASSTWRCAAGSGPIPVRDG